jgi:hypothetical protein
MKKRVFGLSILLLTGCNISKQGDAFHPYYRVQAGLNKGGITENTDFTKTTDIQPDAFSGATKTGFNVSGHLVLPLKRNAIETGIDYMYNNQRFTFNDGNYGYNGTRKVGTSQLIVPITYNLGFFKKNNPLGSLQVKIGYLMQVNMFSVNNYGTPTDYSTKGFSSGITAGISATPFRFENGNRLGFYFDGYRGTKIYDDFYNRNIYEMPGSSFMKIGIIYQFGKKIQL